MNNDKIDEIIGLMKRAYDILLEIKDPNFPNHQSVSMDVTDVVLNEDDSIKVAIKGDQWPVAANPNVICDKDKEEDKINRAKGVVSLMVEDDLTGKKFLDFGCGEGHMAYEAAATAAFSVGYDISYQNWENIDKKPNLVLTSSWNEMKSRGPYNVILMFDVLDHAETDKGMDAPGYLLKRVADELLVPGGRIYLRCHPWCSRHGTHLYHEVNRAFAHLVLKNGELLSLGMNSGLPTHKIVTPIRTYRDWIETAQLKIENERIIKEPVEPFFKTPKIAKRVIENCQLIENGQLIYPDFQMSVQFCDYVLSK